MKDGKHYRAYISGECDSNQINSCETRGLKRCEKCPFPDVEAYRRGS